jgi:hypothetical protein
VGGTSSTHGEWKMCLQLGQYRVLWRAFVSTVTKLQVPLRKQAIF